MDIRAACAKVEATACKNSLAVLSEELLVAQLAKVGQCCTVWVLVVQTL
jgi:hypothetical protein